ncbi:alpha/beta hydrolase [Streptomyces sp. NPDC058892]|uniref:alpha/beta hydrolase n=1 Tax=unclassified Streptomyces TaxID=2593676 RepID=UPI00367D28B0
MRTPTAHHGAAAAALLLALCAPTAVAAPVPRPPQPPVGTPSAGATGSADAESAGAALVARRAALAAASRRGGASGLDFRTCPAVEELPSRVRCATLRVPLDYARPDGPQISLTVSRAAATGAGGAARQGALVQNPGGPGASGMRFPLVAGLAGWERIAAAYDLVGYAPRGVGRSAPLSCTDPAARTHGPVQEQVHPSPAYKAERLTRAREYARGCARRAGAALPYYTTLNNARDLHVLRAALGEEKLTFMGASYGTYLGAVYATQYPRHVRRMVLDSAVDPDPRRVWYRNNLDQARGFEGRWHDFRSWVARHHGTYGLGTTPAAVQAGYERVRDAVSRTPAGGTVGTGELRAAFLQAAYYDDVWPDRAAALAAFLRGDPSLLAAQATPDPATAAAAENATAVYTAVLCNDASWPADWETWDRDNTELARTAPFETWANAFLNLPCASWPVAGPRAPVAVGAQPERLPRTLVVAAERDGATPYPGALELQRRLGAGASLVTETGAGSHGVVGGRNGCVDRHVERYLLTGATPGWRATCAPHPEPAPVSLDDGAAGARRALLPPVV